MGAGRRWLVVVAVALAGFAGCWLGLAGTRVMDTGTQVGLASVPLVVVLAVLGAWAERAREPKAPQGDINVRVQGSPLAQSIGQMDGVIIGPGASLPGAVFHLGGERRANGEPLRSAPRRAEGVVVVGDVPQEPTAFQPRASLVKALDENSASGVSVVFAVTGTRGVGKSQVAAAYARQRIADKWRLVAWVDAGDMASVLAGLAEVGAVAGIGAAAKDAQAAAIGVRHWLEADGERRLVVFDNVADLDGLRPFLPAAGAARVVITSNRRSAADLGTGVPVDVFAEGEALAFLAERTGLADQAGARELAEELGWLPLGLAQAAALIARERLGYATYLQRLRALPVAHYLERVEGDAYPYRVAEAIVLSMRGVEDGDPSGWCAAVMGLVSVLAEAGVSRRVLQAAAFGSAEDAVERDAAVGRLADASLVGFSLDGSAVVTHRLVMRVVREWVIAHGRLPFVAGDAVRVLSRLADGIAEAWQDPPGVRELAGHVSALVEHMGGYGDVIGAEATAGLLRLRLRSVYLLNTLSDSTGQAILIAETLVPDSERLLGPDNPNTLASRYNLAYAYRAVGRVAAAIRLYERSLADCDRVLGTNDPDTLSARNGLAAAYVAAGRVAAAIALLERTLADYERILGIDHPDTLTCRNNLAAAYNEAGRVAEAIPLYERTLADSEQVLGIEHPDTLGSRNNLAAAYQDAGRVAEAIPLYERTLADREQVLGIEHPDTLGSRMNLAGAYQDAGRVAEAIPLLERTLADYERILGADHPDTLTCRMNLAGAYAAAGRVAEAIPLYERTLADREQVLGIEHPDTLGSRNNLAAAYQGAGRVAEAIPLYERTLADREQVLGIEHPDTLGSRNNLAAAYQGAGRVAEAIPLYEQALADRDRVNGPNHPHILGSRMNLAGAYQDAGRVAEAIPLLERTLLDYERVLGIDHPDTLTCRMNLAGAYQGAGRVAEAIPLLERTLADCERVQGADHPAALGSRINLAGAYQGAGRVAEAIPLLERTLADCERVQGADHPDTLTCRINLGAAYQGAGRVAEAIPLLERTLADCERIQGADHPDTLTCRNNLGAAYQGAGRVAEAIPLLERTLADYERVMGTGHPLVSVFRANLAAVRSHGR